MLFIFARAGVGLKIFAGGVALVGALASFAAQAADTTKPKDIHAPGTRNGPFVVTSLGLGDLTKDGYEIRGNLGTALVLQKAASIYTCTIPPDPEHLSYRSYFVCSELKEERETSARAESKANSDTPRLELKKPQR